jgi:hypothetical protein
MAKSRISIVTEQKAPPFVKPIREFGQEGMEEISPG